MIDVLRDKGAQVKRVSVPIIKYMLPFYFTLIPAEAATNLARFNAASTPQAIQNIARQIVGVSDYAPYEQGAQQTVVVQDPPQQIPEESPRSSGDSMMAMSSAPRHDPFEFLDFQG